MTHRAPIMGQRAPSAQVTITPAVNGCSRASRYSRAGVVVVAGEGFKCRPRSEGTVRVLADTRWMSSRRRPYCVWPRSPVIALWTAFLMSAAASLRAVGANTRREYGILRRGDRKQRTDRTARLSWPTCGQVHYTYSRGAVRGEQLARAVI